MNIAVKSILLVTEMIFILQVLAIGTEKIEKKDNHQQAQSNIILYRE